MARERIVSLRLSIDPSSACRSRSPDDPAKLFLARHASIDISDPDEAETLSEPSPVYEKVTSHHSHMGRFMDQISSVSAQIHAIQAQLPSPSPGSTPDCLYNRSPILALIASQIGFLADLRLSVEALDSNALPSERKLRLDQIASLSLRLSDVLLRLRDLAQEERHLLFAQAHPNLGVLELEGNPEELSRLLPEEVHKLFLDSVRLSRNYPQARQAAASATSQLQRLFAIDVEMKQSDALMQQLLVVAEEGEGESELDEHDVESSTRPRKLSEGSDFEPTKRARLLHLTRYGLTKLILLAILLPMFVAGVVAVVFYFIRRSAPSKQL